jgi:hypothetical protein
VTSTISVVPSNGFTGSVSLGQSGCPSGVVAWFGASPITGSTTLYISVGSTAKPGNATITVTGTNGSLKHTATVALTIN